MLEIVLYSVHTQVYGNDAHKNSTQNTR